MSRLQSSLTNAMELVKQPMEKLSLEISNICIGTYAFMLAQNRHMQQQDAGLVGIAAIGRSLQGKYAKQARQNVQLIVVDALQSESDLEPADLEHLLQILIKRPILLGLRDQSHAFKDIVKYDRHAELSGLVVGHFWSNHEKASYPTMALAFKAGMKMCHSDHNLWAEVQEADYRDLAFNVLCTGVYVNQIDANLELFLNSCADTHRDSSSTDPLLFCLALRYAREYYHREFSADSRLLELQRALRIARADIDDQTSKLEENHCLATTIAEVNSLNSEGKIDSAMKLLKDAESLTNIDLCVLYDKVITQAILTYNIDLASEYELKKLALNEYETYTYLEAFECVLTQWFEQGIQQGLVFDIMVANDLAIKALEIKQLHEYKETLYSHLGKTSFALGEQRHADPSNFRTAATALQHVLKATPREKMPMKWAEVQYDLGTALERQGRRVRRQDRAPILERSIIAYRCSLEERTQERTPKDWVLTLQAIGDTLGSLFDSTKNEESLTQAIIVYEQASDSITQADMRILWAEMQVSIGQSLVKLNELHSTDDDNQLKHIEQAKQAFLNATSIFTKSVSPGEWGKIQEQLANVEWLCARYTDEEDQLSHLHLALTYANAALEELDEIDHFLRHCSAVFLRDHILKILAEIDAGNHSG